MRVKTEFPQVRRIVTHPPALPGAAGSSRAAPHSPRVMPSRGRRGRASRGGDEYVGDAFLLQASVVLCAAAAVGWTVLQIALYGGTEPALIVIPLLYIAGVAAAIAYERFWCVRPPARRVLSMTRTAASPDARPRDARFLPARTECVY